MRKGRCEKTEGTGGDEIKEWWGWGRESRLSYRGINLISSGWCSPSWWSYWEGWFKETVTSGPWGPLTYKNIHIAFLMLCYLTEWAGTWGGNESQGQCYKLIKNTIVLSHDWYNFFPSLHFLPSLKEKFFFQLLPIRDFHSGSSVGCHWMAFLT